MKSLTPEQLAFLERYGFDETLFATWRKKVKDGTFSLANNAVKGKIRPPEEGTILDLPKAGTPDAQELEQIGREAIARGELGVVILNGGMATRFGGVVKGTVEALTGRSFLRLGLTDVQRCQELCGGRIPVFLMNSFATESDTRAHLARHSRFGLPEDQISFFNQFISVRMTPGGGIFTTKSNEISAYGPGHGDFAPALRASGCLKKFQEAGGRYLFVSNVDNLGARVSPRVLGHHVQSQAEVTVEVAPKWPGDIGGSPFLLDGKLQLIEQIRFPADFDADIVDVFNTNTFTFTAAALDQEFDLGWYFASKQVEGKPTVQIERLIGEMTRYLDSNFVKVKRTGSENRFLPVKTPDDLAAAREEIAELYP